MNHEVHQQQVKEVTTSVAGQYASTPSTNPNAAVDQPVQVAAQPTKPSLSDKEKEEIVSGAILHLLPVYGVVNTMRYIGEALSENEQLMLAFYERFAVIHPQAPLNSFTIDVIKLAIESLPEMAELFELHDVFEKLSHTLKQRELAFQRYEELQNKNRIGFLGSNMGLL